MFNGESIELVFDCGHYFTNSRPAMMTEEDRAIALVQAICILCPQCDPMLWEGMARVGTYPQLHAALRVID